MDTCRGPSHGRTMRRAAGEDRWPVPRTVMLVTVLSAGLWLLIGATARWLLT
jgi:hypothetical protein